MRVFANLFAKISALKLPLGCVRNATINNLGRYEIIKELDRGAMGVVYKAKSTWTDRNVAVKTINLQDLKTDEMKECKTWFYQAARGVWRLSHCNIVAIYDLGEDCGMAYITMELLEGNELHHLLNDA